MSELDQTIEELEAEILEEMNEDANAPKKSAKGPDKMQSIKAEKSVDAAKGMKKAAPPSVKTISAETELEMDNAEELEEEIDENIEEMKKMMKKEMMKKKMKEMMKKDKMKEEEEEDEEEMDEMMKKERMKKEMMMKKKKMEEVEHDDEEEVDEMKMMKASKMKKEEEDEDDDEDMEEMMKKEKMKKEMKKMKKEEVEERLSQVDVTDDVEALTNDSELTEEFKEKASVIFEAAVKSKLREEIQRIEEEKEIEYLQYIDEYKDELTEKVDKYMNYVVEQWMNDNQLAVERGLKGEIAEDFISGLKTLFEEHYIDVPNEKYDILEAQAQQIEELEEKLNEQIQNSVDLNSKVSTYIKESIFNEVSAELSDTEQEKFKSLIEDLEYIDEESFKFKLNALKESYFPKTKTVSESVDSQNTSVENVEVSDSMAKYLQAITTTKNRF